MYIFCSLSSSSLSLIQCLYFNKKLHHTKLLHTTAPGCTRWRKIGLGSPGIFSFLTVILDDFSFLYYLTFSPRCAIFLQVILHSVEGSWNFMRAGGLRAGGRGRIWGLGTRDRIAETPIKYLSYCCFSSEITISYHLF